MFWEKLPERFVAKFIEGALEFTSIVIFRFGVLRGLLLGTLNCAIVFVVKLVKAKLKHISHCPENENNFNNICLSTLYKI